MRNMLRKSESNDPHGEANRKENIGKEPLQNTQVHGYPEREAFREKNPTIICNAGHSAASVRKISTPLVNSHQKSTKAKMTKKRISDTNSDTLVDLQQICTRLKSVKRSMRNNNLTTAQRNEIDKTLELSESLIQKIRHSMYECTPSNSNVSESIQSTNVPTVKALKKPRDSDDSSGSRGDRKISVPRSPKDYMRNNIKNKEVEKSRNAALYRSESASTSLEMNIHKPNRNKIECTHNQNEDLLKILQIKSEVRHLGKITDKTEAINQFKKLRGMLLRYLDSDNQEIIDIAKPVLIDVENEMEHLKYIKVVLNGKLREIKNKIISLEKFSVECYELQDHDSFKMIRKTCSLFQKYLPENKAIGTIERKSILKQISEISERLEKKSDQQKIENKNSDQNQIVKAHYSETDGSSFCQKFSKLSMKPSESEIFQCDIKNRSENKWNDKKSNEYQKIQNANEYENGFMADIKSDPKFCELDAMSNKLENSNDVRSIQEKKESGTKEPPQDPDHSAEKSGNEQGVSGTQSVEVSGTKVTQEAMSSREVGLDQSKESNYNDTDKSNMNRGFSASESSSVEVEVLSEVEQSSCSRKKTSNEMKLKQIEKRRDEIKSEIESFAGITTDQKFYELKEYSVRLLLEMDDLSFPKGSEQHSRKRELLKEVYRYTDILEKKAEMFLFVKTVEGYISYFNENFNQFKKSRDHLKAIEKQLNHFKSELDELDPENNLEDRKQRCIEQINSLNKAVCEEYQKILILDMRTVKNIEEHISYLNENLDQLKKAKDNLKRIENTLNCFKSELNQSDPENNLKDRKRRCIEQINNLKKSVSEEYRKIRALELTSETENIDLDEIVSHVDKKQNLSETLSNPSAVQTQNYLIQGRSSAILLKMS